MGMDRDMFDTMTLVKTFGALCGALLIFLLGSWFADVIYSPGHGAHGEEHAQGYHIEIGEAEEAEEVVEVPFEEILASADVGKGEKVFKKCAACHSTTAGENKVGPYLAGVVGRPADTADGFAYSGAFEGVVDVWTPEHLNQFLTKPSAFAPGTTMGFAGLGKESDRANVIAYLMTLGG